MYVSFNVYNMNWGSNIYLYIKNYKSIYVDLYTYILFK